MMSSAVPRSQCGLGAKSYVRFVPSSRTILVLRLVLADRDRGVRQVGELEEQLFELGLRRGELGGLALDVALERRALGDRAFAFRTGGDAPDLLGHLVLGRLQRLRLVLEVAHAGIGGDDAVEVDRRAQPSIGLADVVGGLSQQTNVDHGGGA